MDKNLGILDKKYPNCSVYVQDVGELPEHIQKQWFTMWDSVIKNRFVDWYNLLSRRNPYERVDFDYNGETGDITVWTDEGKEFFKTKIKGIKETTLDANGDLKKESYTLYRAPNGNNSFSWPTDSLDSIAFEFIGSKKDYLKEDTESPPIGFSKYQYRKVTDHLYTGEDLKEEIFNCLREMGLGDHIPKLQDVGNNPDYDAKNSIRKSDNGGYYTITPPPNNYWGDRAQAWIYIPWKALPQYYPYWAKPDPIDTGLEALEYASSRTGRPEYSIRTLNNYGRFGEVYIEFGGKIFKQILKASDELDALIKTYPSLTKLRPAIVDTGSRKIIYKVAFYFKGNLVGGNLKSLLDAMNAGYVGDDSRVVYIALDKLHQVSKKILPLLREFEKREQEMNVLEISKTGDTYEIIPNKEKGTTTIKIMGEYSISALKRLFEDTKARVTFSRTDEGDLLVNVEYRWPDYPDPTKLVAEIQILEKFLNNPLNKKEKAKEFDRDNWGIIYHRAPSKKNLEKSAGYFVEVVNLEYKSLAYAQEEMKKCIQKADWDSDWYPLHWSTDSRACRSRTSLFINPFWFLKQGKGYQLSMLKQGIAAADLPYSASSIINGVIACCRDAVKNAQEKNKARNYREKLQRSPFPEV